MMLKILVYGYAAGVFSSRKMAKKLYEDVGFPVLAAGNYPAHRTICDLRADHLKELSDLFVQVVKLAKKCGLVKLGTIAVDGTKIKANASRHKAMSYDRMKKVELELKAQIDALLTQAKAADAAEKNEPELDLPAEITRQHVRFKYGCRHCERHGINAPVVCADMPPQPLPGSVADAALWRFVWKLTAGKMSRSAATAGVF